MFDLFGFISYVAIVMYTPGPNNIMSMAHAKKHGFRKTLDFMMGVFTGVFVILILSSYFNLLLYENIPVFKQIMGPIGAAYMIYLAIMIIKTKDSDEIAEEEKEEEEQTISYITGTLIQFLNPKGLIFGITVTSTFILPYFQSFLILGLFSGFLAAVAFSSVALWGFSGTLFKRFFTQYGKIFNWVLGLLLIYTAISISGLFEYISG